MEVAMILSGFVAVVAVGAIGGGFAELLRWYGLRESENLPAYSSSVFYWLVSGLMMLGGGVLAAFYGTENVSAILVANIGASAPLIIKALAQTTPPPPNSGSRSSGGGGAIAIPETSDLLQFLAGR